MNRIKIGLIDYLNPAPFYKTLESTLINRGVEFVRGVPSTINLMLANGDLDAGIISAFEAAVHAREVLVLPEHTVSVRGGVRSVLLFSWATDPAELHQKTIALTGNSATSVHLLRVLLRERYGIEPKYVTMKQDLDQMMGAAEAALLIGDDALIEGHYHRQLRRNRMAQRPSIIDLGDEWMKFTGLPFTFAVWAVRDQSATAVRDIGFADALRESKQAGLASLAEIAARAAPGLELPPGVCLRYLRDLSYDLDDTTLKGLNKFVRYAVPSATPFRFF